MDEPTVDDESLAALATTDPIVAFFKFEHLPVHLRIISKMFADLATKLCRHTARSAERTVALRKLLESKDCAVRCGLG